MGSSNIYLEQIPHSHLTAIQAPRHNRYNLTGHQVDQVILKHHALVVRLQREPFHGDFRTDADDVAGYLDFQLLRLLQLYVSIVCVLLVVCMCGEEEEDAGEGGRATLVVLQS